MRTFVFAALLIQASVPSRGSIEGVVKAGTTLQQFLPNARLELREGPGTPIIVRSDAGGRFIFSSLASGRYRLFLTEDGFIRQEYGQRSPNMPGVSITVAAGQQVKNVVFRLDAAPTITGSVQDQEGNPLADILVTAARRTYDFRGRPTLTAVASATTDDRGTYRIFWVDPGDYYVSAGYAPVRRSGNDDETVRATYAPVYFGGVTDPEGVRPIRVEIGREINGVDFRLRRQDLAQIFGLTMSDITRRPVAATITFIPTEDANVARYGTQSSLATGTFVISEGVAPGSYIVVGQSTSGEKLAGFTRIKVPSLPRFFLNVRLEFNRAVPVHGRMTMDSELVPDIRQSRIVLMPAEPGAPSPAAVSPLADGQFVLADVIPGEYFLTVANLPNDTYVKAARQGKTDILETPITIVAESAASLEVRLGSDGGRIDTAILDGENRAVSGARVVLVPDVVRRHRPDQYRVRTSTDDGRVTLRGIPPGDYKLFAWESIEPNAYLNADYLHNYDGVGLPVRIGPGQNGPVQLRLIPAGQ
ncbi:MAG: hypothetical protein DMG13_27505 [Acidobacteria bacterium]|nr:MAG: hypothetical protein DMG13_27505 [Acidobacteriota bacterium]